MGGLHHSVTSAFAVSGTIREKGYYKTTDGTRTIRKTKDGKGQIWARHQIIEHCIQAGYPWMDRYHLSQSGQPFVVFEGENYVMTDLIRHPEADFSDTQQFMKVIKDTAHWHRSARGISFTHPLHKGRPSVPLVESFQLQGEVMDAILKRIRKQSPWSDFDVLFLKNYPEYRMRIQKAKQLLESTGYIKRFNAAREMNHICHGGLKEDCLRIGDGKIFVTKLDQAVVDYQLNDLCSLIRRREKGWKNLDRVRIMDVYSQVLPLDSEEEIILEALLLFPLAFVKIVMEYYQKKRSWTPASMTCKMMEVLGDG